jgi:hypothetical protein
VTLTVQISGCHTSEARQEINAIANGRRVYSNVPVLFINYESREAANFAVLRLNAITGIRAKILGD